MHDGDARRPGCRLAPGCRESRRDAAMKPSTCRYFHCENAFACRWKSTRREATIFGRGFGAPNDNASAAIETACGSCACTIAGVPLADDAGERHAVARSISFIGASGSRSAPSEARRYSSPSGCATSTARWPRARSPSTVRRTCCCPPRQVRAVSMWRANTAPRVSQTSGPT